MDETYLQSSDVTSQFTTTNALSSFSAYANPYYIQVKGVIKTGTTDQTFLVNNIPTEYRPTVGSIVLPTFWLNGTDAGKGICVYCASESLQVRCSSAIAGSSGVLFSGMWIRK